MPEVGASAKNVPEMAGGQSMRIFMVSPHYYPDTFQVTALSAALVRRGHQVRILTGLPDYTTSRVPEAYR